MNKPDENTIPATLLRHYDDFAAFNNDLSFLCDAFACLAATSENLDESTIAGFKRHSDELKYQSNRLKVQLHEIRMQERNSHQ